MRLTRLLVLIAIGLAALGATAERTVPFRAGETLTYDVSWSGYVTAGTAVTTVREKTSAPPGPAYALAAEGRPTPLVSNLYHLSYQLDSLLDATTLLPRHASTSSEEGRRRRVRTTAFDRAENKGRQDVLSALYVLRATPMKTGDRIAMAVSDADKRYAVRFDVGPQEPIRTPLGDLTAWKVAVSVTDEQHGATGRNVALWLSTDARRLPLKLQAELPVGRFVLSLKGTR
jgi:uncharacterized protein DUF3108